MLLAPTINLMRTPLGGRGFELFGEDPVLTARLAVAYVDGLRQAGVAAAVKHYVGNDSETDRRMYDARIAEHVLRELYLVPFEACVREADPHLVMTAYNKVNGTTMTENAQAAARHPQARMGLSRRRPVRLGRGAHHGGDRAGRLDLSMPGPDGPWGGAAGRGGRGRPGVSEDLVDAKVRAACAWLGGWTRSAATAPRPMARRPGRSDAAATLRRGLVHAAAQRPAECSRWTARSGAWR